MEKTKFLGISQNNHLRITRKYYIPNPSPEKTGLLFTQKKSYKPILALFLVSKTGNKCIKAKFLFLTNVAFFCYVASSSVTTLHEHIMYREIQNSYIIPNPFKLRGSEKFRILRDVAFIGGDY